MPDRDALAADQLGVHPRGAVGSPRCLVDRADQVRQPGMPDRPRRRRPGGPGVVSRARYPQRVAATPDLHPVTAQLGDQAVALFGGTTASTAAPALRRICTSSSRSRIRCRAAASSALSAAVVPGFSPRPPDRDAATGTGTTRQSLARQRRHAHSALTRPDQGHGGGTQADTVSAWLILSDCRAPFVSRHACPLNRVKINVCPRYEGKPTPASGPCLGARCAGDHRRWPTTVSATSEYPPIWSAIPVRWVGVVMAPNSHSVCERLPLLVVVLGGGVR